MRRGAVYVRVSTDIQESVGTSLDTQQAACLSYATRQDLAVAPEHIYREVFTGALYRERPRLTALRMAARAGAFTTVVIYAYDRLSRDQTHLAVLIDDLEHAGVKVACVTEQFDETPTGQLLRTVIAFSAEMERLKILERTQRGKLARMQSGKLIAGRKSLYGYRWADSAKTRYVIDPTESAVVQRVFALSASGVSSRRIAIQLMDDHIPTPFGRTYWNPSTIVKMLKTTAYTGYATQRRIERTRAPTGKLIYRERPLAEQVPVPAGVIPPLIDAALFDEVQRQLAVHKMEASRNNPRPKEALLRCGMARCGVCGKGMQVVRRETGVLRYICGSGQGQLTNYRCRGAQIVAHTLDDAVWAYVTAIIQDYTLIVSAIEALQRRLRDPASRALSPIQHSISKVDQAIANLVDMLKEDRLHGKAKTVILAEFEALETRREHLLMELAKARQGQSEWRQQQQDIDRFVAWCHQMQGHLDRATYEDKRMICRVLQIKATVWRRDDPTHDQFQITVGIPNIMTTTSVEIQYDPVGNSGRE